MILIDINQTVSLVFSGDWSDKTGSTSLKLTDRTKNVSNTYPLTYVISHSTRFTEYSIVDISGYTDLSGNTFSGCTGFTELIEQGQYLYEFIIDNKIIENGVCKVIGSNVQIPVYLDTMSEYVVYKN